MRGTSPPPRDGCGFERPAVDFRRGGEPVSSPVAPLRVRYARRSPLPWCPSCGATFSHGATLPGSVPEATDEAGHLARDREFAFQKGKLVFPHVLTWLCPHFSVDERSIIRTGIPHFPAFLFSHFI
ncbi:hypothetical protein Fmac_029858 [Flemingia macrophylla]|uniref:Uncharacterized protein n=1 Tax=Flemingia macrophylla TaxID=520843 RepID=A0ABD1LBK2_9FABA